ncbi:DNA-directed RNA polymerase sigma-70 factor [Roseobacter cerasinus]|uniref:DNA-directed RNA polymerase sigma-70 factor n=1 Tax=Roseobacter cerasinus TaxID=2602289 RepID=A0A640VQE5_9RHOB|nr:RNA polymerase sigma factor [Roseobacter cerasinus]GFE48426.1 DNA-directed RNA polymerase sigma-70 factor [Roseobacter cerasinus]
MSDQFADDIIAFLPNLRRFAISLCRSPDTADDLVQITVERAFAARHQFTPDTRLDAWLFRILRNAWIDMTRRTKTRGTQIDIDDAPEAKTVDGTQVTETSLMLTAAKQAIDTLPEEQRDVILLICAEELSYKEASEVLGTPIGTVMSRLSRARLAIAKKLGINPKPARSSGSQGDS